MIKNTVLSSGIWVVFLKTIFHFVSKETGEGGQRKKIIFISENVYVKKNIKT
jgi:hypothetical protein